MAFPNHILEEIKSRIPLSSLVGQEVKLKQRTPNDFWGLSPFQSEKTPSFHVRDDQQFYHCFATGEHGNHFSWLMQRKNMSFMEAVKQLADQAGVTLPSFDPKAAEKAKHAKTLYEVCEFAASYYQQQLENTSGAAARDVLKARGLLPATIRQFRIGFAPKGDAADLIQKAAAKNITVDQLIEAGLLRRNDRDPNRVWPLFKDRIMFPIEDVQARVIAFGGRFMGDAKAAGVGKYINSPETPLFNKSHNLYHFGPASAQARTSKRLIVAEGYMDVIALFQAGYKDAIAPLGTAVTHSQLNLLWRFVDRPVFCMDGDVAGQKAAIRAAMRGLQILKPAKTLGFAFMPQGDDPDSLLQKPHGNDIFDGLLQDSVSIEKLLLDDLALGKALNRPEQRAGFEKDMYDLVNLIEDETVKRHYRSSFKGLMWDLIRDQRSTFTPMAQAGYYQANHGHKASKKTNSPLFGARLQKTLEDIKFKSERGLMAVFTHHPALINRFQDEMVKLQLEPTLENFRQDLEMCLWNAEIAEHDDQQEQQALIKQQLIADGHGKILNDFNDPLIYQLIPQAKLDASIDSAKQFIESYLQKIHQDSLNDDSRSLYKRLESMEDYETMLQAYEARNFEAEAILEHRLDDVAKQKL